MNSIARGEPPLVSVLIAAYNAAPFIAQTLDSVLGQTYSNIEIVVVDDGSSDETWAVLQSYGGRIRTIRQPNGGIAAARNAGLQAALGELIALMDHDDICEPERIALSVLLLRQRPDVVLCSSDFSAFSAQGPIADSYCQTYYVRCSAAAGGVAARYPAACTIEPETHVPGGGGSLPVAVFVGNVYEEIVLGNFVHPPTILFRRTLLERAGAFDPASGLMCDWDWLVRAARAGSFAFIDLPLVRYRRSETQISSPRYQARSALDSMRVSMRVQQADPELALRRRRDFRASLAEMCLSAADVNVEHDRAMATRLVGKSVFQYGAVNWHLARTLARLCAPAVALRGARRLRNRIRGWRAALMTSPMLWTVGDALDGAAAVLS